jgi:hypothetical protein
VAEPWERLVDETPKAWEAFVVYRDMGPARSLQKVAKKLKKSKTLIDRWSSEHAWVIRARGWDAEEDRLHRLVMVDERRKLSKQAALVAQVAFQAAVLSMRTKLESPNLRPNEAARFAEVGARITSILNASAPAAGMDGVSHDLIDDLDMDLDSMTDEERRDVLLDMRRQIDADLAEYEEDGQSPDDLSVDVEARAGPGRGHPYG